MPKSAISSIGDQARGGVEVPRTQRHSGHRSAAVMHRYIRHGSLFRGNVAAKVRL